MKALEADRRARAEHERVLAERNRFAEEMERMAEAAPAITALFQDAVVWDAFSAVAALQSPPPGDAEVEAMISALISFAAISDGLTPAGQNLWT